MISFIIFSFVASSFLDSAQSQYTPEGLARNINTNVLCGYRTDCVVDCSNTENHVPCANAQIDGTDAKSLTVICDSSNYLGPSKYNSGGYSGCEGARITCPFNDRGSKCTVLCSNPNDEMVENGTRPGGCRNTFISTYVNRKVDSLEVSCSGTNACQGLDVYAPSYAKGITDIECHQHSDEYGDGHDACSQMRIHAGYYSSTNNWLDLDCEPDQCDHLELRCGEEEIGGHKTESEMVYNEGSGAYECDNEQCCPLVTNSDESTTTAAATQVLRGAAGQDTKDGLNTNEGWVIALVVVCVLLVMMCFVSGYLVLKLQKEKHPRDAGSTGFVQLQE